MTKVSARSLPKMIDNSKKEIRMTRSEEMLTRHHSDPHIPEKLVTMDETWSPCSIPEQKGGQNNGNIQTRHPRKHSDLARLQRKFSIQFSWTGRALFSQILSQSAWPSPENVPETFWRISCCLQLQKSNLNWWGTSSSIKTTLHHTRLELSQNSWWNRELRHFDILPIHLTLLRAISGWLTPWNSLSEEHNFLWDQVYVQQFTSYWNTYLKTLIKKCYEKWVGCWQLCLDIEGDYVE